MQERHRSGSLVNCPFLANEKTVVSCYLDVVSIDEATQRHTAAQCGVLSQFLGFVPLIFLHLVTKPWGVRSQQADPGAIAAGFCFDLRCWIDSCPSVVRRKCPKASFWDVSSSLVQTGRKILELLGGTLKQQSSLAAVVFTTELIVWLQNTVT